MENNTVKNLIKLNIDQREVNRVDTDIKAEVVAAGLIEKGVNPDLIKVVRDKAYQRNWNKDIDEVIVTYSQSLLKDFLIVKTNRSGLYDILPEGIFHKSKSRKLNKDKEDAIEEIQQQRKEEFYARKFFHLFESILDDTSIQIYLYEAKFDKKINNPDFINIFVTYWPILKHLEKPQAIFFLHTIPILHKIRTQFDEIEEAMSLILDTNVHIEQINTTQQMPNTSITNSLGNVHLGVDWIIGDSFYDGEVDIKLKIGPIPASNMINYLEHSSKGYVILDYLCNLFFSANTIIQKELIVSSEDANFYLSDENHITHLGINTFL